jgi:hypothetical protein
MNELKKHTFCSLLRFAMLGNDVVCSAGSKTNSRWPGATAVPPSDEAFMMICKTHPTSCAQSTHGECQQHKHAVMKQAANSMLSHAKCHNAQLLPFPSAGSQYSRCMSGGCQEMVVAHPPEEACSQALASAEQVVGMQPRRWTARWLLTQ